VVDALEDFLGAPLAAHRIEGSYDVAAQLLTEMCDAGLVSTTEPNALRDLVEVEGFMGKLLGSISLPGYVTPRAPVKDRCVTLIVRTRVALPYIPY
jgi:AP-3 complex subunit mu